jgi:hypothetical protein
MRWMLVLLVVIILAGCGGRSQPAAAPQDTVLQRHAEAAQSALSLEHPADAAAQYKAAFVQAEARDDAKAIGDYGYDLAVAQLAANQPREARASARLTQRELARRGVAAFPALVLTEAVALYRTGARAEADGLAAQVEAGSDPAAAARATFLRGLIADETGDGAGLNAALTRLAHPTSSEDRADVYELTARRDMRARLFARAAAHRSRLSWDGACVGRGGGGGSARGQSHGGREPLHAGGAERRGAGGCQERAWLGASGADPGRWPRATPGGAADPGGTG